MTVTVTLMTETDFHHTCVHCIITASPKQQENLIKMVRKLKFHEQKLLKKVDFISWKVDNNLNEVKVMKKYHIQKREDYTK